MFNLHFNPLAPNGPMDFGSKEYYQKLKNLIIDSKYLKNSLYNKKNSKKKMIWKIENFFFFKNNFFHHFQMKFSIRIRKKNTSV